MKTVFILKWVFFDKKNHEAKDCHYARNYDSIQITIQMKKRSCGFRSLGISHVSKLCRLRINFENCDKRHHVLMYPGGKEATGNKSVEYFNTLPNSTRFSNIFLQTSSCASQA